MHVCKCSWAEEPHPTFGACLRSKGLNIGTVNHDVSATHKAWDKHLNKYAQARRDGLQPTQCTPQAVNAAYAEAEAS